MATTANLSSSPFSVSGRSSGASQTPIAARLSSVARCACQTVSGTMILPAGTSTASAVWPSSRRSTLQSSETTSRPLMMSLCDSSIVVFPNQFARLDRRGIDMFLERRDAEALRGVDEAFVFVAFAHIHLQQAVDHFRHLQRRERRPDDLADRRVIALRAADRDLVPLAAVLVDAQHADRADMVVAAGVDAAR